jgi:hypothetical protein
VLVILSALFAVAAPPEQTTAHTVEGDVLVVEKKGRGDYKVLIESAQKGDDITCTYFMTSPSAGLFRTPLAMQIKTAGERAKVGNAQLGNVLPYNTASLTGSTQFMPGICTLGLDAMPNAVVLTMGTMSKLNGRSATIAPDDAIRIGSWLMQ